jgi:uncharacterized membrane protein YqiK
VKWNSKKINHIEINEMLQDLWESIKNSGGVDNREIVTTPHCRIPPDAP